MWRQTGSIASCQVEPQTKDSWGPGSDFGLVSYISSLPVTIDVHLY